MAARKIKIAASEFKLPPVISRSNRRCVLMA